MSTTLNAEIISFLRDSATKVGELGDDLLKYKNKGYRRTGKYWETVAKIKKIRRFQKCLYETTVNIIDGNGDIVYNFLPGKTNRQIRDFISKAKEIGDIIYMPYARYNFRDTSKVVDTTTSASAGQGIPEGGADGYYITKDSNGNLVWKQLPSVVDGGVIS